MIETTPTKERVLLLAVQTQEQTDYDFETLMKELVLLTDTAGGEVVRTVTQKLEHPNGKSLVGKGKLEEVVQWVEADEIDLIITMNRLSPRVNRYLEEECHVRVIDRVQLILDIFALRARSREGKLQVELAQYDYQLPRLHGQGASMSRLGAGIGTRGPGETKLETDRRYIRSRMTQIKHELKEVSEHRDRTRTRRQVGKEFNIGLVGYTNAGKSTLLTQLTKKETYVKDQLFATLDPLTRQMTINGHRDFTLTDTVGFIEELPTELIHAFESTLEELAYMNLLLHVVDASSPARELHEQTVYHLLTQLDLTHIPVLTVYNKKDKLEGASFTPTLFPNVIISAYNEEDIHRLKEVIWENTTAQLERFEEWIQPDEADLIALYQQKTFVESLVFDEGKQCYHLIGYRRKN